MKSLLLLALACVTSALHYIGPPQKDDPCHSTQHHQIICSTLYTYLQCKLTAQQHPPTYSWSQYNLYHGLICCTENGQIVFRYAQQC